MFMLFDSPLRAKRFRHSPSNRCFVFAFMSSVGTTSDVVAKSRRRTSVHFP
jgi:hypothetical protein